MGHSYRRFSKWPFEDVGIKTILRNWEGSNIVEIPIRLSILYLWPDKEDFERAKDFYCLMQSPKTNGEDWHCESAEKRWNLS